MRLLDAIFHPQQAAQQQQTDLARALMHYEAQLGGQLFGPVPKGTRREFFRLDTRTWVWHEEWTGEDGKRHAVTTSYDVRGNGVVKSQGPHSYQTLSFEEAYNLRNAVRLYHQQVGAELRRLQNLAPAARA
jgi:hypothetical protein